MTDWHRFILVSRAVIRGAGIRGRSRKSRMKILREYENHRKILDDHSKIWNVPIEKHPKSRRKSQTELIVLQSFYFVLRNLRSHSITLDWRQLRPYRVKIKLLTYGLSMTAEWISFLLRVFQIFLKALAPVCADILRFCGLRAQRSDGISFAYGTPFRKPSRDKLHDGWCSGICAFPGRFTGFRRLLQCVSDPISSFIYH